MTSASIARKFPGRDIVEARVALGLFGPRAWLFVLAGFLATLIPVGIPTAIIENPIFSRMTATRTQDYLIWIATALLAGLTVGTFAVLPGSNPKGLLQGGVLSFLAVGCPICNKLVVALIGVSGALTFFAPLQLYLGLLALLLLAWTFLLRLRSLAGSCALQKEELSG